MNEYKFKVTNSNNQEGILKIIAIDIFKARDEAYQICYKCGLCFLGRL